METYVRAYADARARFKVGGVSPESHTIFSAGRHLPGKAGAHPDIPVPPGRRNRIRLLAGLLRSPMGREYGRLRSMPDYSLFGDEHVRQYEATGGKVGHDWNEYQAGTKRDIPVVLLHPR